jgi:hypothetical protein
MSKSIDHMSNPESSEPKKKNLKNSEWEINKVFQD